LLEVLLAVAVFAIGVGAVAHYYVGSMTLSLHVTEKNKAVLLAKEGVEAIRSIGCDDPKNFFEEIDLGEEEKVTLVFKGTVSNISEGRSVDAHFQWGPVEEGDSPEESLIRATSIQTISEDGEFYHEEEIETKDFAGEYAYRAVVEDNGSETRGDIKIIP